MERFKPRGKGAAPGSNSVQAQNKKVEDLRGALIAVERALGRSVKDIAADYHVTQATVKKYLDAATEGGFLEHFRYLIYERLAGKALAVYEAQLELGNLDAARDIAFGLNILQKSPKTEKEVKVIDSLATYRQERQAALTPIDVESNHNPRPSAREDLMNEQINQRGE